MTVFTVHLPPETGNRPADAERAVFVPEAFSWGAFVFGPLWLLGNRAWLAFLLWCAVVAALGAAFSVTHPAAGVDVFALFLVALFFGVEGRHFVRLKLDGGGYRLADVVSAPNVRDAERTFFLRWLGAPPAGRPAHAPAPRPQSPPPDDVIGLFPEAGGRA